MVKGNHCPIFFCWSLDIARVNSEVPKSKRSWPYQWTSAADVPGVRDAAWCGASTAKIWQLVSQQQPSHSVGPVSDSKSTEDFEFWTWFEPCFLLLQLELHVSTWAVAANEEVAESNARMTSLAGYSGLSSMTLWILWICIFSLGWRDPWCQFPASGSSHKNHSLPFWTLSLYVSLFWSDTPVQMAHLAVWNGLRFMTVEHIPENASIQELSSVCNSASNANKSQSLNTSSLALRGQAMPRPSSAVLVPLILMEVPFLWIASCRSFVSSLLPPDSEEGHGGTTSPTSSS